MFLGQYAINATWGVKMVNPKCSKCGKYMAYNVQRLGADGGFIHKHNGRFDCEIPHCDKCLKEVVPCNSGTTNFYIHKDTGKVDCENSIKKDYVEGLGFDGVYKIIESLHEGINIINERIGLLSERMDILNDKIEVLYRALEIEKANWS